MRMKDEAVHPGSVWIRSQRRRSYGNGINALVGIRFTHTHTHKKYNHAYKKSFVRVYFLQTSKVCRIYYTQSAQHLGNIFNIVVGGVTVKHHRSEGDEKGSKYRF